MSPLSTIAILIALVAARSPLRMLMVGGGAGWAKRRPRSLLALLAIPVLVVNAFPDEPEPPDLVVIGSTWSEAAESNSPSTEDAGWHDAVALELKSVGAQRCLGDQGDALEHPNARVLDCRGWAGQQWVPVEAPAPSAWSASQGETAPRTYQAVHVQTGLCLSARGEPVEKPGSINASISDCDGRADQLWVTVLTGQLGLDTVCQVVSVETGQCLDVLGRQVAQNRANVIVWPCHGQSNQMWTIRSSEEK